MSEPLLLDPSLALDRRVLDLGGDAAVVSALVEHLQNVDGWTQERDAEFLEVDPVAEFFFRDIPDVGPGLLLELLYRRANIVEEPQDIHSFVGQLGGPVAERYEFDPIARILAQQAHYLTRHSFGVSRSAIVIAEYKRANLQTLQLSPLERERIRRQQPTELLSQIIPVLPRFVLMFGLRSLLEVLGLDDALTEAAADAIVWLRFESRGRDGDDLVGDLERLAKLRANGDLNSREYAAAKRRLVGIPNRRRS